MIKYVFKTILPEEDRRQKKEREVLLEVDDDVPVGEHGVGDLEEPGQGDETSSLTFCAVGF
jgi:hypothetical protein